MWIGLVWGLGGNTIDLAPLSMGINEEYIKVSVPLKHSSTKALNTIYPQLKENPTTYDTNTEIVAANQFYLLYNIQERLAVAGQPHPFHHQVQNTCDALL